MRGEARPAVVARELGGRLGLGGWGDGVVVDGYVRVVCVGDGRDGGGRWAGGRGVGGEGRGGQDGVQGEVSGSRGEGRREGELGGGVPAGAAGDERFCEGTEVAAGRVGMGGTHRAMGGNANVVGTHAAERPVAVDLGGILIGFMGRRPLVIHLILTK